MKTILRFFLVLLIGLIPFAHAAYVEDRTLLQLFIVIKEIDTPRVRDTVEFNQINKVKIFGNAEVKVQPKDLVVSIGLAGPANNPLAQFLSYQFFSY